MYKKGKFMVKIKSLDVVYHVNKTSAPTIGTVFVNDGSISFEGTKEEKLQLIKRCRKEGIKVKETIIQN